MSVLSVCGDHNLPGCAQSMNSNPLLTHKICAELLTCMPAEAHPQLRCQVTYITAVPAGSTLNDGLLDVMYAMDLSQEQVITDLVALSLVCCCTPHPTPSCMSGLNPE